MEYIIYQVDAFTNRPFRGNPAGVVIEATGLKEEDMKKIAMEMNLSETAFVFPKNKNNYEVRFFTPKCEVDLCGHATIAIFHTLAEKGYIEGIENGRIEVYQETKVGKLPVEIYYKNGKVEKIMMYQGKPKYINEVTRLGYLAGALGIREEEIGIEGQSVLPQIISTGLPDILLPLKSKKILDNLRPQYGKIKEISKRLNVTGIHAFTIDKQDNYICYCRNFAPLVGINEESATGTSNGALLFYLKRNNILSSNNIISYQGESLNRLSEIYCEIEEKESEIFIKVGGKATIVIEGVLTI